MSVQEIIRPPAVAGMFYEKIPSMLRQNVDELLQKAQPPKVQGTIRALISPHAGYVYSGFTAAHAYKLLAGKKYDCVIGVGPSHREHFEGISVYSGDAYQTPLGTLPIHPAIRSELLQENKNLIASQAGHRSEHSLEVQLPFLQNVLGEFSFIPIIMGDQRRSFCDDLSMALAHVMKNHNILLIASSDLSHYHSYEEALRLDNRVIQAVKRYNTDEFLRALEEKSIEACGGGPIAVAMKTASLFGAAKAEILHYCNSGDITGDKREVVGYLSAAFV